jgi:hypothetical protein
LLFGLHLDRVKFNRVEVADSDKHASSFQY